MKFVDPKNDLAFKKIFGNENKKEILISFLNSVLDFKGKKTIIAVSLDNPYQLPDIKELKETILDIKATNQNGDKFIVEMQKKDLSDFDKRSLYYTSKAYVSQIEKGEDVKSLKKVYYIAILNFNMFDNKNYISRHLIINQETTTQDLKDFEFTFVELKKFNTKLEDLNSTIDKWIYFINNASSFDLIPKEYENIKEFKEAFEIANKFSWNKNELNYYDSMDLRQADDKNALDTAIKKGIKKGIKQGIKQGLEQGIEKGIEQGLEQGIEQGLEQGIEKGIEQGIEQGLEKGIEQGLEKGIEQGLEKGIEQGIEQGIGQGIGQGKLKEKLNIAKNLLDVLDNETISIKTGLSIQEIKDLRT